MRENISISLSGELKEELDRITRTDGVSRSDLIRRALQDYLFAREIKAARRRLMARAEARGILTDEDVFREIS